MRTCSPNMTHFGTEAIASAPSTDGMTHSGEKGMLEFYGDVNQMAFIKETEQKLEGEGISDSPSKLKECSAMKMNSLLVCVFSFPFIQIKSFVSYSVTQIHSISETHSLCNVEEDSSVLKESEEKEREKTNTKKRRKKVHREDIIFTEGNSLQLCRKGSAEKEKEGVSEKNGKRERKKEDGGEKEVEDESDEEEGVTKNDKEDETWSIEGVCVCSLFASFF